MKFDHCTSFPKCHATSRCLVWPWLCRTFFFLIFCLVENDSCWPVFFFFLTNTWLDCWRTNNTNIKRTRWCKKFSLYRQRKCQMLKDKNGPRFKQTLTHPATNYYSGRLRWVFTINLEKQERVIHLTSFHITENFIEQEAVFQLVLKLKQTQDQLWT